MTLIERLATTGIRRIGGKTRGFRYRDAGGRAVSARERERIEALRIPPAWTQVFIHPSRSAWLQAIGRDAKGRWQYLYHAKQATKRERIKLERLIRFIRALPELRRAVDRDLGLPGMPRERVLAGIVRILSRCFLRPGSEAYATENGSYGIATLRPRHVSVRGDTLRFDFKGKSGQRQVREVRDRRVAALVRELLRHRGEVFKYRDEQGAISDVRSRHINAYIQERMGERFSAKDFRTWAGTLLAACTLARVPVDARATAPARKRAVATAMREVSQHLGNTPAVCRASYVFPVVLRHFEKGRVLRHPLNGVPRGTRGTERCERELLSLLASGATPRAAARRSGTRASRPSEAA